MKLSMKNMLVLIPFILVSCLSFQRQSMDIKNDSLDMSAEGIIQELQIDGSELTILDENKKIKINFSNIIERDLDSSVLVGYKYIYMSSRTPEGPVEYLSISNSDGLTVFLGDRIGLGQIPGIDLSINYSSNKQESLEISGEDGSWIIQAGKKRKISIQGEIFNTYLLNYQKGNPDLDQPPFKADLMLIRQ